VDFAVANEPTTPRDLTVAHLRGFGLREPLGDAVGPFRERGDPTGIIVHQGYIVAEWGEPDRVDNTFSVTKSFLSATVGLAWDRGLIGDLDEPVAEAMAPVQALTPECVAPRHDPGDFPHVAPPFEPFTGPHSSLITWDHLLRQTSEWQGTLWGKPDWADRPRGDLAAWRTRERPEPGTVYTYNDVRVNLLALAALNVWRRPLPQVLKEHLMDPIGASHTWRWYGYDNSWVVLDGHQVMLQVAFSDHQVANIAAEVEGRTIGAHLHDPPVPAGLHWAKDPAFGFKPWTPSKTGPLVGRSVLVYWHSTDRGLTWTVPERTELPNNNSAVHQLRLADGRLLLIFNDASLERDQFRWVGDPENPRKKAVRTPLTLALNALEYRFMASRLGHRVGFRGALRVSLIASIANYLPAPGGIAVRTAASEVLTSIRRTWGLCFGRVIVSSPSS
jgi:CubicO group peptidase (beta-lactamase class C family)